MVTNNSHTSTRGATGDSGNLGAILRTNPLINIPQDQSLEQFQFTLKQLASNVGYVQMQRFIFAGCMCLVAGLGWSLVLAVGVPTFAGAMAGSVILILALLAAYVCLRQTQWLALIGFSLRETSVMRSQLNLSTAEKESAPDITADEDAPPTSRELFGLTAVQIVQIIGWIFLWIACATVVSRREPGTALPPPFVVMLLGLATYLAVRVGVAFGRASRSAGIALAGFAFGAVAVACVCIWPYGATPPIGMFSILVSIAALGAVWSLSLFRNELCTMAYVTIHPGSTKYHCQTPDLRKFGHFLLPILFTIVADESTVLVLRRISEEKYQFHDIAEPIAPLQAIYDIFDLTKPQIIAVSFNQSDSRDGRALKVSLQYDCHPRTPLPEEVGKELSATAVKRFTEVFFHGVGLTASLSESASPWVKAAVEKWFDKSATSQELMQIRNRLDFLTNVADNLTFDPNAKDIRVENLPPGFREFEHADPSSRQAAATPMQLLRGDMAAAERLNAAVGNSLNDVRNQIGKFREHVHDGVLELQKLFEAEVAKAFEGVDDSYKVLVSLLSLRISTFDVALEDIETELLEVRKLWGARFNEVKSKLEQTLREQKQSEDQIFLTALGYDVDEQQIAGAQRARAAFASPVGGSTSRSCAPLIVVRLGRQALCDVSEALAAKADSVKEFVQSDPQAAIVFARDDSLSEPYRIRPNPMVSRGGDGVPAILAIRVELQLRTAQSIYRAMVERVDARVTLEDPTFGMKVVLVKDDKLGASVSITDEAAAAARGASGGEADKPPEF